MLAVFCDLKVAFMFFGLKKKVKKKQLSCLTMVRTILLGSIYWFTLWDVRGNFGGVGQRPNGPPADQKLKLHSVEYNLNIKLNHFVALSICLVESKYNS